MQRMSRCICAVREPTSCTALLNSAARAAEFRPSARARAQSRKGSAISHREIDHVVSVHRALRIQTDVTAQAPKVADSIR